MSTTARGTSPKARAHLARMRAERQRKRAEREAKGGDWRNGHWLTSESFSGGRIDAPAPDAAGPDDRAGVRVLDFNDRSSVDWHDLDDAAEYN